MTNWMPILKALLRVPSSSRVRVIIRHHKTSTVEGPDVLRSLYWYVRVEELTTSDRREVIRFELEWLWGLVSLSHTQKRRHRQCQRHTQHSQRSRNVS